MAQKKEGAELQETYTRLEKLINDNQKPISIGLGILAILILAGLFFQLKYLPDQEAKAQVELFKAQQYFAADSFNVALNGNIEVTGFNEIKKQFKWTKAANLSNYYAGISNLNLGNYPDAIKYLKKFNAKDEILGSIQYSALGDAYSEMGQWDKALSAYKTAAAKATNEFSGPYLLKKTGMAFEKQGKFSDAQKYYKMVKDKYPNSEEGRDIDNYIARAEAGSGK